MTRCIFAVMQFYAKLLLRCVYNVHNVIRSIAHLRFSITKCINEENGVGAEAAEKPRARWWLLLWFACVKVCLQNILKLQKDFKTISHRDMHYSLSPCMHSTHFVCHSFLPDRHIFYALGPWWCGAACELHSVEVILWFLYYSLFRRVVGTHGQSNLNTVKYQRCSMTPYAQAIHTLRYDALWLVVINC